MLFCDILSQLCVDSIIYPSIRHGVDTVVAVNLTAITNNPVMTIFILFHFVVQKHSKKQDCCPWERPFLTLRFWGTGGCCPSPQSSPYMVGKGFTPLPQQRASERMRVGSANLYLYLFKISIYLAALDLNCDMQDLVPSPGIEPRPPALGAQCLSH